MAYDRRKTFRSPLALEDQAATLTFGRDEYAVRVLNVSAGGFEIMIPRKPPFQVGDNVFLLVTGKTSEVRVCRIMKSGAGAKVGLKLVRDVVKGGAGRPGGWQRLFGPLVRLRTSTKAALIVGGMAAIVVVAVGVGQGWHNQRQADALPRLHRWDGRLAEARLAPELKRTLRGRQGLEVLSVPEVIELLELSPKQQRRISQLSAAAAELPPQDQRSSSDLEVLSGLQREALDALTELQKAQLEAVMRQAVSPTYFLRDLVRKHWPKADARELFVHLGAAALTLPKVADELNLSPQQREQIGPIVEAALDASEELYQQGRILVGSSEMAGKAEEVLEQARKEVLDLLTEQQRARLGAKSP